MPHLRAFAEGKTMSKKSFIDSVKVGSPCTEDWNQMQGTDKVRLCSHCVKHVNNLSEMTRKEAAKLVLASDGNICIRYTVEPVTKRPIFAEQLFQITRRTPTVAAGVMTASIAFSTSAYAQQSPPQLPNDPPTTVEKVVTTTDDSKRETNVAPRPLEDVPVRGEMLVQGLIVMAPKYNYKNALTKEVQGENADEVRDLLVNGVDVNGKEGGKMTPLFFAVENGNSEIAEMLLNYGAKVNARDTEKQTPLMRLDDDATPELVDLLVRHGAKINLTDNEGNTAVILAAVAAKPEVLNALITAGADVRLGNKEGQTALMNAASGGEIESVRLLIQAGADVNAKNKDGETALDQTSNNEIKDLLISFGAETKRPDEAKKGEPSDK